METQGAGSELTPEEARQALELADQEESKTINRPVPWWYYPVLAVLVLVLFVLNAVEEPSSSIRGVIIAVALATALTVAVLVGRVSFHQPGYRGVRTPRRWTGIAVAVAGMLAITPIFVEGAWGSWIWIACGIVLSGMIAGFGIAYWRRYPRG